MAHQDYVSRPQNKNKNKAKKRNAHQRKSNHSPTTHNSTTKVKLIVIFLVIAIPSFVYLLWFITNQQPAANENNTTVNEVAKKDNGVSLPKPPKEKWSYVDDLKEKEVEVGEYEVTPKGPYKMQCGSFKTQKQANALKARIAFAGLEAKVAATKGNTATWYKVFLGPYTKKRTAEKDRHKLKNNAIHGCKIWLWN